MNTPTHEELQLSIALASFLAGAILSPLAYHLLDLAHSLLALLIHIIQAPFIG